MRVKIGVGALSVGDIFTNSWDETVRAPWWAFWHSRGEMPQEYRVVSIEDDMAIAEKYPPIRPIEMAFVAVPALIAFTAMGVYLGVG